MTHERGALPCRGLHPLLRAAGHPRVVNGRRHPLPLHQLLPEGAALLHLDQDDEERPPTTLVANALHTHLNSSQPLEKRHTLSASGVLATIREFANRALVPHERLLKSLAHHSILGRTCCEDDEVFHTSPPKCSTECLIQDIDLLKPISVAPMSTLVPATPRAAVKLPNSAFTRYIPIDSLASSGVVLLRYAIEVHGLLRGRWKWLLSV